MSETTYLKELVVVEDGIAYKFKGISLSNSNASTILDNLISEYTEQYNNLNAQVTALENQLELGQVKFVTDMTTLNTDPLINTLYVNNEVVGIVDDGSGIIPQVYLSDGSSVSLKEVERKEEEPDDGNEYLGYVNTPLIKVSVILQDSDGNRLANGGINWVFSSGGSVTSYGTLGGTTNENGECSFIINPPANAKGESLYLYVNPAPAGHNPINPFLVTEEQLKSTIVITSSAGTILPGA